MPDGSVKELQFIERNEYFCFWKEGSNFLLAISSSAAITNEAGLASADELNGFDGKFYWRMQLDRPVRMQPDGPAGGLQLPAQAYNTLTIIPASEADRRQGEYQADVKLASIRGIALECLAVGQLGCTNELQMSPQLAGSTLKFRPVHQAERSAELVGDIAAPRELVYTRSSNLRFTAALDYDVDTLILTRSSANRISYQTRYHLLGGAASSKLLRDQPFSWQTYRPAGDDDHMIAMLVTNGATVKLDFTNSTPFTTGEIIGIPKRVIAAAQQARKGRVVLLLLALCVVTPALFLWRLNKSTPNPSIK